MWVLHISPCLHIPFPSTIDSGSESAMAWKPFSSIHIQLELTCPSVGVTLMQHTFQNRASLYCLATMLCQRNWFSASNQQKCALNHNHWILIPHRFCNTLSELSPIYKCWFSNTQGVQNEKVKSGLQFSIPSDFFCEQSKQHIS